MPGDLVMLALSHSGRDPREHSRGTEACWSRRLPIEFSATPQAPSPCWRSAVHSAGHNGLSKMRKPAAQFRPSAQALAAVRADRPR